MGFATFLVQRIVFAGVLSHAWATRAAVYTDASQLPTDTFDFVIVGGGSAGNAVAARLTENSETSVLVIEAGISNDGVLSVAVPGLAGENLPFSAVTWNYTTTPQSSLNQRTLPYSRGRVLGGSSSINFMVYTRGADAEYDRWAKLAGDDSWAWKNLSPYYYKSSRLVPPQDGHDTTGQVIPADHGSGPVEVSLPGYPSVLDNRILDTVRAPGAEFPFIEDFQSGNSVGVALVQSTIGNGARSSSAVAYLEPALSRPNLHVLTQNTVTRLVQTESTRNVPSFKKVEFAPSSSAPRSTVTANNEVILSAGTIGTAQILMLSGIGDKDVLDAVNIETLVNLPDVGKNLKDHPILSNYWVANSTETGDDTLRDPNVLNRDLQEWQANRTGPLVDTPATAVGFLRLPDNSSIFEKVPDPSAGPGAGHYELVWTNGFAPDVAQQPATGHFVTVHTALVTPTSNGSIRLASSDPFTFPLIDPNFFSTEFDQFTMVEGVKAARRFMESAPWQGFATERIGTMGAANTDAEILAAARESVVTIWHPTSTARMSPKNADYGVVDPDLLVKGVSGLRVVDASVFPEIPAVHTVAPVYIVAERAADLIKSAWGL